MSMPYDIFILQYQHQYTFSHTSNHTESTLEQSYHTSNTESLHMAARDNEDIPEGVHGLLFGLLLQVVYFPLSLQATKGTPSKL